MIAACVKPLPLYKRRDPQASDMWRLMDQHFETFQQVYDERFAAKYGFWRPIIKQRVTAFLKCGDLQEGFARVRCPDCKHEMFVAHSCKQAEKQACRAFPDPKGDGTRAGVKRNFQILEPLDFLAEFTQHIPPKGSHLIRYYGWYSNKSRGMRKKAEAETSAEASAESSSEQAAATGSSQAWAMLIKRVYEVDPLWCPECGGQMKVVSFIEPPQADVIEAILTHCGLWQPRSARAPPEADDLVLKLDAAFAESSIASPDQADESQELTYVDIDTFLASF